MSDYSLSALKEELLALLLEETEEENLLHSASSQLIIARPPGQYAPLSFAQQRLWFLDQLESGSALYNIPDAVRLKGLLDEDALRRTLNEIVRRHEILRTTFATVDGTPVQVIAVHLEIAFPLIDLSELPSSEREAKAMLLALEETQRPFDLSTGPLIRAGLIRLDAEEHVALFTLHHIISDGWSMGVLVNEVGSLYRAYAAGHLSPLPELPIQYADYAHWQRQWLSGEVLQQQLAYWNGQLNGSQTLLDLPTDRARPAVQTYNGAGFPLTISVPTTAALHALARQAQGTLFMTLTAAFSILLSRYANQSDICIGTPIANRNRAETESLIGFFVNTLVLRTQVQAGESFAALLEQVRSATLDAYAHQDVPFEQLVDALKPERHTSQSPLFQVVLALQNAPMGSLELPGLTLEGMEVDSIVAKFDLTLNVTEDDDQLVIWFEYNTDLFDRTTMERMAAHFMRLLDAIVANPAARIADLPMLGEEERHQLLVEWNDTATDYPQDRTIHQLFEAQAERTPDNTALVFEDQQLCYAELNAKANRLAHYLRSKGVGPDVLVGICVERSLEMIIGLLGILKAGGAYVPLDPAYPQERLAYMLADAKPALLLTQQHLQESLPADAEGIATFCLDSRWDELAQQAGSNPANTTLPGNLAYVIYTSGSTGKPKGTLVQHTNVARLFSATETWFGFNAQDTWTLFHSYAFDFSVWEIWGALLHGGKLVIVPYLVSRSPDLFHALLVQQGVTILNQTPSAFQQLVDIDVRQAGPQALQLREVIFGGEALNEAALSPWFEAHGETSPRLVNMYGITETTVHVTYQQLQGEGRQRGSIGRPIPDLRAYILDAHLNPVPVGVPGELHVSGDGLARGYLNRPELTAEKFIPHPYSTVPGARMYRSGDLARYLPDGNIEYLGRIDTQVKIRGFRIELGEIEAALAALSNVREAVVLVREDVPGDRRLVAYVVAEEGQEEVPETTELRRVLLQSLPDYMVPSHFMRVDAIPLSPNGKLDRKALPAPDTVRSEAGYVAPRTQTEEILANIWADVLKLDRVGIHDNFFESGGDSMRTIAIVSKAREHGFSFKLEHIFKHQTIAGLVDALPLDAIHAHESELVTESGIALISDADRLLLPKYVEDAYPLSRLQLGMVFHNQLTQELGTYHDVFSFHLRIRHWDLDVFQIALDALTQKHPILRTSFGMDRYSEPLQLVHKHARIPVTVFDLATSDTSTQDEMIAAWIDCEKKTAFDLAIAPLLRIFIHHRSAGALQYTLSFHHAIIDGWSVACLQTELFQEYAKLCSSAEQTLYLKPLKSTFKSAIVAEVRTLQSAEAKVFWEKYLEGHSLSSLPVFQNTGSIAPGNRIALTVTAELRNSLGALANSLKVPLRTVLLTAHLRVMSMLSGADDVTTGMVSHFRPEEQDGEQVLGLFLNTLPFRKILNARTWTDLIVATFATELMVMPYRAYPYSELFMANGRVPLFETAFNYVNFHVYENLIDNFSDKPADNKSMEVLRGTSFETTNFALTLNASGNVENLQLSLRFDPARLSFAQAQNIADYYSSVLKSISLDPDASPHAQSYLSDRERQDILCNGHGPTTDYSKTETVHQLFEAQAARLPDNIALVFEKQQLTYGELNARANRLAHYLRSIGVGPDTFVGICVERSPEMVIGLIGILKAGGAYVPLDPAYPKDRLTYMLEDAKPAVLLTQQHLQAILPTDGSVCFCLDTHWESLAAYPLTDLRNCTSPDNLAYINYTQGSTGRPRGIAVSHGNVVRLVKNTNYLKLNEENRVLQFASFISDTFSFELWGTFLNAACLVMVPPGQLAMKEIAAFITTNGIDTSWLTAALFNQMVEHHLPNLMSIRQVFTDGEALSPSHVRQFLDTSPSINLTNGYGLAESTAVACYYAMDSQNTLIASGLIGRPVTNTQIYLLDAHLNPVPVGAAGELHIAGDGLARGYLNRADLTAEKFIPNPFSAVPGARMYRSGDLARYLPDGNIEFLGRLDTQVKIRGFRIELGEIEAALSALPQIREAVVLAREDVPGDRRLVAYVVVQGEAGELETTGLRSALLQSLPEYMVPAHFMVVDAIPLTPNGKLDRKALPVPEAVRSEAGYVAPRTQTEEALAAIWAEVLQLDRVGIYDNFFELGGNSLLAVILADCMRSICLAIDIRTLFATPTIAALAAAAATDDGNHEIEVPPNRIPAHCAAITPDMLTLVQLSAEEIAGIAGMVPGGAANIQDIYPLAPLQEGILFHHLMSWQGDAYILPSLLGFDSRERLERFTGALQHVIDRHDILRTAVHWEGLAEAVQVVWRHAPLAIEEISLDAEEGGIAQQLSARHDPRSYRLDVRQAPMLRGFIAQDSTNGRWLLQILAHHMASDNTTLHLIVEEIQTILQGRTQDLPKALPFRNFVAQAKLGVAQSEHEEFFTGMLAHVDEPTAPFGLYDVQGDGSGIEEAHRAIDASLAQRIRKQARSLGVSAASLMHLAWAQVLARASGRQDVVFGTVLFGRMQGGEGADRVMGMFINTLPVCISVGGQGVEEAVRQVHALLTQLLRHEHASLALAQRCSGVEAPAPLFSSLLNYRHSAVAAGSAAEAAATQAWEGMQMLGGQERTNYPVTLSIDDLGEGFVLTAQVASSIKAQRICDYMHTVLEHLAEALEKAPQAAVNRIDMLPQQERHRLLVEWNDTATDYPQDRTIHQLFEAQAERTPDNTALVFEDQQLSYAELNAKANRLAHYLRSKGVGPDVLVGICVERSLEMIIGLLGILKAGGAYVPLDPAYPQERLAYMLADAKPALLLTQQHLQESLPADAEGIATFCLDSRWDELAQQAGSNPANTTLPGNLAYVIYTSGSTGKPKGTLVQQHGVLNLVEDWKNRYVTLPKKWSIWSSVGFDVSVFELFVPLTFGASLFVVPDFYRTDPVALMQWLGNNRIESAYLPPSFVRWIQEDIAERTKGLSLSNLLVGVEPLLEDALFAIQAAIPDLQITNGYGPTEATVYCSLYEEVRPTGKVCPIGQPIANTQVYLLDVALNPVPVGVAGELHIAGDGLARGYLNRADLTAEKFIPNPFSAVPGARMYRSGDLARYLPDGNIEFLGRLDTQVKIRGFRIELGEIEAALSALPQIREAVVLAREDVPGDRRLVAYVVVQGEAGELETTGLRSALLQSLPEYMVPAHFMVVDAIPLTPNGKLDRKALPVPEAVRSEAGYVAPRTQTEEALAAIWAEVLQLDRVGIYDNFFELGGHSLLAVNLAERMRRAGLATDIRTLFATPTIAALAAAAADDGSHEIEVPPNRIPAHCAAITPDMLTLVQLSAEEIAGIAGMVPGGAANIQDIYPLAPLQEGILFHHLMSEAGDAYILPSLLGFDSRERLERFTGALQHVIDRHDILRTAVHWEGLAEAVQVVWRHAPLAIEEISLDAEEGGIAQQLSARHDPRSYRLDVRQAPMLRGFIAQDSTNGRWLLQILAHHMVNDHTTLELIVEEIQTILQGRTQDLPKALPFRNFVAQAKLGVAQSEHEEFFTGMLAHVDEPTAPFGLYDVQGDGSGIEEAHRAIDASLAQRIRKQARSLGVSAASLMHLAWAQVLARASGRQDVVFGTVLFGRMQGGEGADRVMGMFINTLPVCISVGGQGVEEAVRQVHALLTQLLRHEHASLALAQRCSGVEAPAPLFSSLLNYRHSAVAAGSAAEAAATQAWEGMQMLGGQERTNYPVTLSIDDLGEGFVLTAQVASSIKAQRICDYMHTVLEHLAEALEKAPQAAVNRIDMLPQQERHRLLVEWNDTATDYPQDRTIHQLFEAQAERTPDNTALVFEDQQLSYAELNAKANRLAHYLRSKGVGPDVLVGICVERSLEMIIGLLGILKAGGAYVPLDPAYPQERLAYMLADAKPALLLTQQHLQESLPADAEGIATFCLDSRWDELAQQAGSNPANTTLPGNLAYVIYTSGSTGKPKGVSGQVSALVNRLNWMQMAFPCAIGDMHMQKTSMNFIDSITETLGPLLFGGRLHIASAETTRDPQKLWNLMAQEDIGRLVLVPSLLEAMLRVEELPSHRPGLIVCSGEALPAQLVHTGQQLLGSTGILNLYGSSEVTGDVTFHVCAPGADAKAAIPLGRPIANTQIYLLDANLNPVPVGVAGELHVAGDGLARGYLNRPELTAEKFIANPFSSTPGARMYRSGDLARYLPDGNIEYLGRLDNQVKIRGFRIELGEIEAALAALPQVREAVVLAREDEPGDRRLVAYMVAKEGQEVLEVAQLRSALVQSLPEYMVPGHFVVLEQMPLTPNGKVDRKAMPAPDETRGEAGYMAPTTETEATLAAIWAKVLKLDRVGIHDNFFALGGNSLLIIKVHGQLSTHFGTRVAVVNLFKYPTIDKLSRFLSVDVVTEIQALASLERGESRRQRSAATQKRRARPYSKL